MIVSANFKCDFANLKYEKLLADKYFVETCFSKKYESYSSLERLKDLWLRIRSLCVYPLWKDIIVEDLCEEIEETDLTPIIDIDDVEFIEGQSRDMIVNINEVAGGDSYGQVQFKVRKMSAFHIWYDPASTSVNVGGSTDVNNTDWLFSQDNNFITVTLKPGKKIDGGGSSLIGFTVERVSDVPVDTTQNVTVTIVTGSGGDSDSSNNQAVASFTAI